MALQSLASRMNAKSLAFCCTASARTPKYSEPLHRRSIFEDILRPYSNGTEWIAVFLQNIFFFLQDYAQCAAWYFENFSNSRICFSFFDLSNYPQFRHIRQGKAVHYILYFNMVMTHNTAMYHKNVQMAETPHTNKHKRTASLKWRHAKCHRLSRPLHSNDTSDLSDH